MFYFLTLWIQLGLGLGWVNVDGWWRVCWDDHFPPSLPTCLQLRSSICSAVFPPNYWLSTVNTPNSPLSQSWPHILNLIWYSRWGVNNNPCGQIWACEVKTKLKITLILLNIIAVTPAGYFLLCLKDISSSNNEQIVNFQQPLQRNMVFQLFKKKLFFVGQTRKGNIILNWKVWLILFVK